MQKFSTKCQQIKHKKIIRKSIRHAQVGFILDIQSQFSIQKSINAINHINRLNKKKIIPIDVEKGMWQNATSFMIKALSKVGIKNFFNLITNIYKTTSSYIILNNKKLEIFPLRSDTRQECHLTTLLLISC